MGSDPLTKFLRQKKSRPGIPERLCSIHFDALILARRTPDANCQHPQIISFFDEIFYIKDLSFINFLIPKQCYISNTIQAFIECSRFHGSFAIHSRRSHHPPESDARHASWFCRCPSQTRAPVRVDAHFHPVRR